MCVTIVEIFTSIHCHIHCPQLCRKLCSNSFPWPPHGLPKAFSDIFSHFLSSRAPRSRATAVLFCLLGSPGASGELGRVRGGGFHGETGAPARFHETGNPKSPVEKTVLEPVRFLDHNFCHVGFLDHKPGFVFVVKTGPGGASPVTDFVFAGSR